MPDNSPDPSRARLTRRAALAAILALGLGGTAACKEHGPLPRGSGPGPRGPSTDPDVAVAAEALAAQRHLIDLLDATTRSHPELRGLVAPALTAHRSHAALLAKAVPRGATAAPTARPGTGPTAEGPTGGSPSSSAQPTQSPSAGDTGSPATPVVPRSPARAVDALAVAERDLAATLKRQALRARSGPFARLLGSMAAAAAQAAAVLAASPIPRPSSRSSRSGGSR